MKNRKERIAKLATEVEDQSKNIISNSKFSKINTTSAKYAKNTSQNIVTTEPKEKIKREDVEDDDFNPFIINDQYYPQLHLEIINSWLLPKGLNLKINPFGIENSLRNKKDGFTFFGYQDNIDNSTPYIDYVIHPREQDYDERYLGRHFYIKYNQNNRKYYIKDLGFGFGTFMKINNETLIKDHCCINIGESFIVCMLGENNKKHITVNIVPPNNNDSQSESSTHFEFNSEEKDTIVIGREFDCDISIEDKMLSKTHCMLYYDNEWRIKDGYEGKQSTNGTWMYLEEETEINEGMVFKANHNLFECKYKYN